MNKNTELKVSIVIPNFNGEELLKKNLPKVFNAVSNKNNKIIEVIVVDDNSSDSSVSLIKTNFPEVKLIRHKVNRGFSASVNMGVRMSKGELVALINTDVEPEPDFLAAILPHFAGDRVFAVSLHEKGYGWAKGEFSNGFVVHRGEPESETSNQTFWVNGGSGVFKREYWMNLGGMDEKILSPFYWEDLDLCYRALKRGYQLLWEPNAKIYHEHEATIKKLPLGYVQRIQERNQLLFIWKNLTSSNLFRKHLVGLLKRLVTHPGYIRIVLMALVKMPDILKARGREKKETKISDEAIFAKFT